MQMKYVHSDMLEISYNFWHIVQSLYPQEIDFDTPPWIPQFRDCQVPYINHHSAYNIHTFPSGFASISRLLLTSNTKSTYHFTSCIYPSAQNTANSRFAFLENSGGFLFFYIFNLQSIDPWNFQVLKANWIGQRGLCVLCVYVIYF